jgi:hypothetical protein
VATDFRRFRGHLAVHAGLILACLLGGGVTVAVRSTAGGASSVRLPPGTRAATRTDPQPTLGPLSEPPSRPVALDAQLAARGYQLPEGANAYAVRIVDGVNGRTYEQYQAGGGALAENFWPASSIKVLAALGALDFVRSLGFTGAADVTFGTDTESATIRSIYEAAIRDSSNYDYDLLVRIAGEDRLNSVFLTAANGFPVTSITRSYAGGDVDDSPPMVLHEGDKRTYVPAREADLAPECQAGNCSNLFEMAESVRRIVLDDELPAEQRFDLDPADVKDLTQALLDADGFFPPAVTAVFGDGARIYDKPGDAADLDCLDVALIETADGRRYELAATVPHSSGGCDALVELATDVLRILSAT